MLLEFIAVDEGVDFVGAQACSLHHSVIICPSSHAAIHPHLSPDLLQHYQRFIYKNSLS